MARQPEFLYFDLGNVLLHFDVGRASRQVAEAARVDPRQARGVVFEGPLLTQYELGEIDDRQFFEAFREQTGSQITFDAFQVATCAIFDWNVPMLPLVVQLGAAGYRLGILSNTNQSHWAYCTRSYPVIAEVFEQTVLSFEVHVMKPDPEIFGIAAERAGVAPDAILFVDDLAENVAGARRAGFDAVQYTNTVEISRELLARGMRSNF
jgi:putative hydrolase of the HAD superfamily